MYEPIIFTKKTVVMQRIQQYTARGYCWHIQGSIPAHKALNLVAKFDQMYCIGRNDNQRSYAKKKGKANAVLFLYPVNPLEGLRWWLLATDGLGDIHTCERLIHITAAKERLHWNQDYELVMLPREGKTTPTVTWRMTRDCYQGWHSRIRIAVRDYHSRDRLKQAVWSLYRCPGFSEIRTQVKRLSWHLQKEWQRSRKPSETSPVIPKNIGYVRGISCNTIPLALVCKRMQAGKRPFPRSDKKD